MGRKKITFDYIRDDKIRRVTLKKRRVGLLKKAIQLSKLTGAKVQLKVYYAKDKSLIEYYSHSEDDFANHHKRSSCVNEYSKFFDHHYDIVQKIDEGALDFINNLSIDLENHIEGINLKSMFSLAKEKLHETDEKYIGEKR